MSAPAWCAALAIALAAGATRIGTGQNAQPASDRVAFEVASVKRNLSRDAERDVEVGAGGRFSARYATLRELVQLAYPNQDGRLRKESQIVSRGPGWIASDHFDVVAKAGGLPGGFNPGGSAAGAATPAEFAAMDRIRSMLRTLLADRFGLIAHNEVRNLPVFALVLNRKDGELGPRLRRVEVDCAALRALPPPAGDRRPCGGFRGLAPGHYNGHAVSMAMIAERLSASSDRVVVDRTGLGGVFDIDLEWTPQELPANSAADRSVPDAGAADPFGTSIVTALQEQLGLKLESRRAPVDVLVIDHAEIPAPD